MAGGGIRTYTSQDIAQGKRIDAIGAMKPRYLYRIKEYLDSIGDGSEREKERAEAQSLADVVINSPPPGYSPGRSSGADLFNRQMNINAARARAATMSGNKFDVRDAKQKLAAARFGGALRRAVLDSGASLQNAAMSNRMAIAQNKATVGNAQMGLVGSVIGAAGGYASNKWGDWFPSQTPKYPGADWVDDIVNEAASI